MCITGACPPYYYGTGRVARQVFGWSTDLQKQIESSDKKPLDKPTSLNQNPIMCKTLKFQTAVIVAIRASLSPNKTVFSSYDVTQKLREQVNSNEIAFSDKTPEDINGNTTFRVEAEDVKEVIQDFYNGGLLTRTNNGRYFEYSVAPFNTVASSVRAASPQTTPTLPPLAAYVPKAVSQS